METDKIKLFSYVHKVKGIKNWVLEDLVNGKLFVVTEDESNIPELKKSLIENELAFETKGEFVNKYIFNIEPYEDYVMLRNLYIRVTEKCLYDCNNCGEFCLCYRNQNDRDINNEVIDKIILQFKSIPVENLIITGGNPFIKCEIIKTLKKGIKAEKYVILFKSPLKDSPEYQDCTGMGFDIVSNPLYKVPITESTMKVDPFTFFYSQKFNLCLGHSIGLDVDGAIKPCLWYNEDFGNILNNDIQFMIQTGRFDKYWELNKDKVTKCKNCEFRFACTDCRAIVKSKNLPSHSAPIHCDYNPSKGTW